MSKKNILLLGDDIRSNSGVGTISRDLVLGTVNKYNYIQIGGAARHDSPGQIHDLSESVRKETGIDDAIVKIYCSNGYGNMDLIRNIIVSEKIDGIVFITDPRYYYFLFNGEWEIRQNVPMMYLQIWDDLPDPHYNKTFYASCDVLMAISKQTYGINRRVLDAFNYKDTPVTYVPHGINSKLFYPLTDDVAGNEYTAFKNHILGGKTYDFVLLWANRNISRKRPGDVIFAWKQFVDNLVKSGVDKDKVLLLMHTSPVDEHGTDLPTLIQDNAPDYNIKFTTAGMLSVQQMNWLYNIADCTINTADNEGFGLCTCESLMAGTPVIVSVTGGLQDQCGFVNPKTKKYYTADDYVEVGSLNSYKSGPIFNRYELAHGNWVIPVFPTSQNLKGSVPTPYIYEDNLNINDISNAILEMYELGDSNRTKFGSSGRDYLLTEGYNTEAMCKSYSDSVDQTFENWKQRARWELSEI